MPPKVHHSTEPIVQRVHVAGLAPTVKPIDICNRFGSFGKVVGGEQGVDGLGTTGSGLPRNYAFFTLETTPAQFYRCMSMLNGSMWKSHKLRIGPAKPNWKERLDAERTAAEAAEALKSEEKLTDGTKVAKADKSKTKKRKRPCSDPNVGYAARLFETVTPENIDKHRGWVLDSKPHQETPLFPLVVRPSHPIYLPPKAATTSWTRGKTRTAEMEEKNAKRKERETREKEPLRRIKRIRIDPRRYGRKKVVFSSREEAGDGADVGGKMVGIGQWVCEEPVRAGDDEEADVERDPEEVTWAFLARDGTIKRRETVRLSQRSGPHTDRFTALLEKLQNPACSTLPPTPFDRATNPPIIHPSISESVPSSSIETAPTEIRTRSASPPPYVPSAPRTLLYNEEDAFQLMVSSLDDEERAAEAEEERKRLVRLAMGVVEEVVQEKVEIAKEGNQVDKAGQKLPKVEGFANDESDEEGMFEVMRLRGGGEADEEDSDSSESDSDSSSDEEDVKTGQSDVNGEKRANTLVKESLKDMFKPQEEQAASFSLMSGLDVEFDIAEEEGQRRSLTPEPIAIPIASALPPPPPKVLPMYRTSHRPQAVSTILREGPSAPLFGYLNPANKDENDKRTKEAGGDTFWKSQTPDEIEAAHGRLRETLRGFSRRRHREAVKRTKKRSGGRKGQSSGFTLDVVEDV